MKKISFIYIIIACLLWGTSGLFVNYFSMLNITPIQMTAIRGFVASIVMGMFLLLHNKKLFLFIISDVPLLLGAGLGMFFTAYFYYVSMQKTSVSTSATLMYTSPVFVMIYSTIFLKEKFSRAKGIALIFMVVGCALVSGIIGGIQYNSIGLIVGLMSGISYSSYSIIIKIEMQKGINIFTATFYCYTVMSCVALIVSNPIEIVFVAKRTIIAAVLMIVFGVITLALPYFLYNLGLKRLPAGTASCLAVLEPLAASVYSVVLLKEKLEIFQIMGMLLIVSAVIILSKVENRSSIKEL